MIPIFRSIALFCVLWFTASPLYAVSAQTKSYSELLSSLSNQVFDIDEFFFIADGKAFLFSLNGGDYRVQRYMPDFSYSPVHSSQAVSFFEIQFNSITQILTIGNTVATSSEAHYADARSLVNSTFSMQYLYWTYDGNSYLAAEASNGKPAVWYKSSNNKYQPLFNASYLDEIATSDNTFTDVIITGNSIEFENHSILIVLALDDERTKKIEEAQAAASASSSSGIDQSNTGSQSGPTPP